MNNLFPY